MAGREDFKISINVDPKLFPNFSRTIVSRIRAKQSNIEQRAGMSFIFKIRPDIPMLTSRLRTSGYVQLSRTDRGSKIIFDPEDPLTKEHYALYQEVTPGLHHPYGKAFFLSDNILDEEQFVVDLMRKQIYAELRR